MVAASLFIMSCNNASKQEDNKASAENSEIKVADGSMATANLSGTVKDTVLTGTVNFTQENEKVKMNLSLSIPIMANKSVAVHIHEMGDCGDMGKMGQRKFSFRRYW